jgi:hypothetical protein
MRRGPSTRREWTPLLLPAWCVALALGILGPAMAPGYVLSYDMVFVPRLDLTRDTLGLGSALPRAVPVDALTAILSSVVRGDILQKVVLVAMLALAAYGASRLLHGQPGVVRAVAATVYVWNPYIAERLVLGHWALLVAYAALPWLALAAGRLRTGDRAALARLVVLLAVSAITPTGGLLAVLLVIPVVAWPGLPGRWKALAPVVASAVVVNAPWWLPGLLHPGVATTTSGVPEFAARGENLLGPVGSLAGLGGVWNADVVPGSRGTALGVVATVLLLSLAAVGARPMAKVLDRGVLGGLCVAASVGLAVALAGVVPGLRDVLDDVVLQVPAAGILRDGQKWIAPYALVLAPAVAFGVARLADRAKDQELQRLTSVAAVVVFLSLLPDLGWGVAGRLTAVHYPGDWSSVRSVVESEPGHGDVAVLPWGAFRAFAWNDDRTVLDPATRYFPGSVVASADLPVGRSVIQGDDARAAEVRAALEGPDAATVLLPLGVGWVLIEKGQAGAAVPEPKGTVRYDGDQLRLVQLGSAHARPLPSYAPLVVSVDLLVLAVIGAAGTVAAIRAKSRRRRLPAGTVSPPRGS